MPGYINILEKFVKISPNVQNDHPNPPKDILVVLT